MPKPKGPSKESIKRAADRAEGKATPLEYNPLDPPVTLELEELEEAEEIEFEGVKWKPKSRAGRPTKYRPEYAKIARMLVKGGNTIPEIAEAFGISVSTVWLWRSTHEEFLNAFMDGGQVFDKRVEEALGQRAVGYTYPSVKIFQNNGIPVIVPVDVHVPADVNAAKFWLAARQSDKWRVKEELEISSESEAFLSIWKSMGGKKDKSEKK